MEIIISIKIDGTEVKDVKTEVKESIEEKEVKKTEEPIVSEYARFFDYECWPVWTGSPDRDVMTLRQLEAAATNLLMRRAKKLGLGILRLNEVYDMLGMTRTKTGSIVGWVYDDIDGPVGDGYVSFGIYEEWNRDAINGYKKTFLLDFNVDGNIDDLI